MIFTSCACCGPLAASRGPALSRRTFLAGGAAALGATAGVIGAPAVRAQAQRTKTRIDVQHHMMPPAHAELLKAKNLPAARWSVQMSLDDMDKSGIQTSMLSQIQPGTWFGEAEESRKMSRIINEYGAKV